MYKTGQTKAYRDGKKSLPSFLFQSYMEPNNGKDGNWPLDTWRTQKAAHLTGLVMHDYDKLSERGLTARQVFDVIPRHWFDDDARFCVLLAHLTCSGDGLRLVTIADPRMNLADNQAAVAAALSTLLPVKLEGDENIKNADRVSFAPAKDDIWYINERFFTYFNEDYNNRFAAAYRSGNSNGSNRTRKNGAKAADLVFSDGDSAAGQVAGCGAQHAAGGTGGDGTGATAAGINGNVAPSGAVGGAMGAVAAITLDTVIEGRTYRAIIDKYFEQNGIPVPGKRHHYGLQLFPDLRYICDNDPKLMVSLLMNYEWFENWHKENGAKVEELARDCCKLSMWWGTPKRLKAVYAALPVLQKVETGGSKDGRGVALDQKEQVELMPYYKYFWERLQPLMAPPYAEACYELADLNKVGGIFAAGTMFCTLMTRCDYLHYDGRPHRMNPCAFIIGDPAAGKGAIDRMDQLVMEPVVAADRQGREAEAAYKEQEKERATSSKAQRGEALKRPKFPIRYLPSKTSNAVFFRRIKNAVEENNGEVWPLHLYTFDSELDANTVAQSSGAWIGKHDIELKAFHNEKTGVDFANSDSINEVLPVYYNNVATGTPNSLSKKLNLRNINDGYCTRLAIFRMIPDRYEMIKRGNVTRMHDLECKTRQWAYMFDQLHGRMPLDRLVDRVYELCAESAEQAAEREDRVLDYLRKRAVFYATWFTVPRIAARNLSEGRVIDQWQVNDDDLDFASLMYDCVLFWQDYYFGSLLQEAWTSAEQETKPRIVNYYQRKSANADNFSLLPEEFKLDDVIHKLNISEKAAREQVVRWQKAGLVAMTEKVGMYVMFKKLSKAA